MRENSAARQGPPSNPEQWHSPRPPCHTQQNVAGPGRPAGKTDTCAVQTRPRLPQGAPPALGQRQAGQSSEGGALACPRPKPGAVLCQYFRLLETTRVSRGRALRAPWEERQTQQWLAPQLPPPTHPTHPPQKPAASLRSGPPPASAPRCPHLATACCPAACRNSPMVMSALLALSCLWKPAVRIASFHFFIVILPAARMKEVG